MRICCTGGNGMVGQSIKDLISTYHNNEDNTFIFKTVLYKMNIQLI